MTWVRVDDTLPRHPKVMGLATDVKWAYIEALCYCSQYLTNGVVPAGVISEKHQSALLDAGLFESSEEGYLIHDYLKYNPSRENVQEKSRANRSAARKRWADVVQSETHSNGYAEPMHGALGDVYVHVGVDLDVELRNKAFDDFWAAYPRKTAKVKAHQEFDACLANGVDPSLIVLAATRYFQDPNRDPKFTAHPSTWLHQGRWMDETPEPRATKRSAALVLADDLERRGL